jgi:hypothetical protein
LVFSIIIDIFSICQTQVIRRTVDLLDENSGDRETRVLPKRIYVSCNSYIHKQQIS